MHLSGHELALCPYGFLFVSLCVRACLCVDLWFCGCVCVLCMCALCLFVGSLYGGTGRFARSKLVYWSLNRVNEDGESTKGQGGSQRR